MSDDACFWFLFKILHLLINQHPPVTWFYSETATMFIVVAKIDNCSIFLCKTI